MNYTPVFGWYYNSVSDRTASWSGVQFLYNFLITNKKKGVFASEVEIKDIKPGDIIQLGNDSGHFYHSLVVTKTGSVPSADNILICTHTYDSLNKPLLSYVYGNIRFLHIEGVYL